MTNAVLARLHEDREAQVSFIDNLLNHVESEQRDMVEAERANLQAARERIGEIDAQREPLEAFEQLRNVSSESTRLAFAGGAREQGQRPAGIAAPAVSYDTAGEFVVDLIRARGYPGQQLDPDPAARARVEAALGRTITAEQRAVATMTTADTPGVLPKPIIGAVLGVLDAARPFVQSIGVRPLAGVPGKTFSRPYISQHVDVAEQAAEKTELASRALKILSLDLTKKTYGGVVNVSRQDIDWTSPSAWNILLDDLANVYAAETDDAAAAAFATAVTQFVDVPLAGADDLTAWTTALYEAAAMAATGSGTMRASALRLPNTIWASVDMWGKLGGMVAAQRLQSGFNIPAAGAVTTFTGGDLLTLPQIIVPGFPAGTLIVGRREGTEFYEERIGVLSAVEPAILGVEVAYGGYAAFGTPDPTMFCEVHQGATTQAASSSGSGSSQRRR